jgi:hypothetical protein
MMKIEIEIKVLERCSYDENWTRGHVFTCLLSIKVVVELSAR